jgi:hypothetical protein
MIGLSEQEFSSAAEFLEWLQREYARPYGEANPDTEMRRILTARAQRLGVELPGPDGSMQAVVVGLATRISEIFRAEFGVEVDEICAIGPASNSTVNAFCLRSPEGFHAILMFHGLMAFLHKRTKLLTAASAMEHVIYCNRLPPTHLTPELLVEWADELGPIYREHGEVLGARVLLDEPATGASQVMLTMSEAFVLGHEIGHVIAGHLEDEARLIHDPALSFAAYAENSSHKDEYEADTYGYVAMRSFFDFADAKLRLGALVATFDVLMMIGAGESSSSHPSAADRIHHLVKLHFSEHTARLVRRWVDEGDPVAAVEALISAS